MFLGGDVIPMISVAIINVTSYTGLELLRLLAQHPRFVVTSATARSAAGKRLDEVFPQLCSVYAGEPAVRPDLVITEEPEESELAFVCLPHAAAAESVVRLLERGCKVVDLSADFRLHDVSVYEMWYKHTHPAPALLESAVYGLCERYRERIQRTTLVANPGCNATTAILALLPAVSAGIIGTDMLIDVKAALSGAGRGLTLATHYAEANEDVSPYSIAGHRHLPEVMQELEAAAKDGDHAFTKTPRITFMPHLVPMTRGILVTCYADLREDAAGHLPTARDVYTLYEQYYAGEPFVHVVDQAPHTRWSYGTNHCFIHPTVDGRTGRLIVFSCLDNLGKGAAGQAIQNANLLYGLPETAGLPALGVNP
jgi:N-acetyl-gamma-glutamyl-phosphate reductase